MKTIGLSQNHRRQRRRMRLLEPEVLELKRLVAMSPNH